MTTTRTIEKIYDATTRNKLTVTPERVTMRFRKGASEDEKTRVEAFFLKVSTKINGVNKTIRGNLAIHVPSDTMYIVMKSVEGAFSNRFFENEV